MRSYRGRERYRHACARAFSHALKGRSRDHDRAIILATVLTTRDVGHIVRGEDVVLVEALPRVDRVLDGDRKRVRMDVCESSAHEM